MSLVKLTLYLPIFTGIEQRLPVYSAVQLQYPMPPFSKHEPELRQKPGGQ